MVGNKGLDFSSEVWVVGVDLGFSSGQMMDDG